MSLYRSDDPALDAERYMMAMDIKLARRPLCDCCGKHIQDDQGLHYVTNKVDIWLCLECIEDNTEYIEVDE
jgi:hypothetical protein